MDIDINYLLRREQVSLHNALIARSVPARIAHQELAVAYGDLLAETTFPHRPVPGFLIDPLPTHDDGRWEDDGGPAR